MENTNRTQLIMRYLVDQVSEEERARFEELYAADEKVLEELLSVENDLIDAYVSGRMSQSEQRAFQNHYLTIPARQAKVKFAHALLNHIEAETEPEEVAREEQEGPPARPWMPLTIPARHLQFSRMAVVLALLIGGFGVIGGFAGVLNYRCLFGHAHTGQEQAMSRDRQEQLLEKVSIPNVERAANTLAEPLRTPRDSSVASLWLPSHSARGGGRQNFLLLRPGVSMVRVGLVLERNDNSRYDVLLGTHEGRQLWAKKNIQSQPLSSDGSVVQLELPSKVLRQGVYVLKLAGRTTNGNVDDVLAYSFGVSRP